MHDNLRIKIPREALDKGIKERDKFDCLRRDLDFVLDENNKWKHNITCFGYGNGYGVGFTCRDNCPLRLTDLDNCLEVRTEVGKYLIQNVENIK